jgi:TonB family protein
MLLSLAGGALASGLEPSSTIKDERISMRFEQSPPIRFPQVMLDRGITKGAARLVVTVDHTGQLTDVLVIGYTAAPFGEAAERGVRAWTYEPMRVRGESVATQATLVVDFRAEGVVTRIDPSTDLFATILAYREGVEYAPCPLQRLDEIPAPLEFVEPMYTRDLKQHGVTGKAVIEFYIDESGSVRVPAVVESDFWELGVLAMAAVRQWRFAPPTSRGQRVLVHVRQEFSFGTGSDAS